MQRIFIPTDIFLKYFSYFHSKLDYYKFQVNKFSTSFSIFFY